MTRPLVTTALPALRLLADVEKTRASFARRVDCTPQARQMLLRQLATTADDQDPRNLPVMVAALADDMPAVQRDRLWHDLLDNIELADLLWRSEIEPADVAPGAHPSCAWTVASEVIEQDITTALDALCGVRHG